MSITLGNYTAETKKTTGLISDSEDKITIPDCVDKIDINNVQPKRKIIHKYEGSFASTLISGSQTIIPSIYLLPDDIFADGFDYNVVINYTYTSPVISDSNLFSYTLGGNNWFHALTAGTGTITMNEYNCGGSYSNTSRRLDIYAVGGLIPFSINFEITIEQLIPATIVTNICGGGSISNTTTLGVIHQPITVIIEGEEESVYSYWRSDIYTLDLEEEESFSFPSSCINYSVYYQGELYSGSYTAPDYKTYWIDSGAYSIKVYIPSSILGSLEYKLFNGLAYIYQKLSDIYGLADWESITTPVTDTRLEIWDFITQVTNSGNQYVSIRYDLESYECPCDCGTDCGDINIIFYQSCGKQYALKFNLSVQEGVYPIEGESYTQGGQRIKPISKISARYNLVLSEYSDETYLILQELISDNLNIGVIDNIDPLNPETIYYLDTESITPPWNFNSKLGSVVLPVIKSNTIKTKRRNCCN